MIKKLSLAIIALIFTISALCFPVFADPSDASSFEEASSVVETSSTEGDESDFSSGDETNSEGDEVSSEGESSSKYYIPDDSDYFTESLNSLGGNTTSGTITIESGTSAITNPNGGTSGNKNLFNFQDLITRWLWAPIALICLCILVLVILDRIYIVKFKDMDREAKYKAQQKALKRKAAAKRNAAKRNVERDASSKYDDQE